MMNMQGGKCGCPHHWVKKILMVLAWLGFVGFVISSWTGYPFWRWDSTGYFQVVVVLVLLAFSTKMCGCCWKHMMGGKMMEGGMCKDGNCDKMHDEKGMHM